ncbi:MAG: hypothetical protein U1E58_10465 [Tabrizicola sp.]
MKQGEGFAGIIVGRHKERVLGSTHLEVETKLRAMVAADHPDFIGLDGSRARFLRLFPKAFADEALIGDRRHGELRFKRDASALARELLPLDENHATLPDLAARAMRVFNASNLIADRFTKAKLSEVLNSSRGATFVSLAAAFALGEVAESCRRIVRDFKDDGLATWPCLTYLPFLWRPDCHMFLKPTFTRLYAERIGHRFQHDYESAPNPTTYSSLLHMTSETANAIADLNPADNIDLHSFMWVVMDYSDADVVRTS